MTRQAARLAAVDRKSIILTVTGPPDQLGSFVQLCKTIEALCSLGASRTVKVAVDGDGSGNLRFDFGTLDHSGVAVAEITGDDAVRVSGIGG